MTVSLFWCQSKSGLDSKNCDITANSCIYSRVAKDFFQHAYGAQGNIIHTFNFLDCNKIGNMHACKSERFACYYWVFAAIDKYFDFWLAITIDRYFIFSISTFSWYTKSRWKIDQTDRLAGPNRFEFHQFWKWNYMWLYCICYVLYRLYV
jgi:hypothetical protein